MTNVVTENCIKCKYMDCVEVCPVDCFYVGENMLVIQSRRVHRLWRLRAGVSRRSDLPRQRSGCRAALDRIQSPLRRTLAERRGKGCPACRRRFSGTVYRTNWANTSAPSRARAKAPGELLSFDRRHGRHDDRVERGATAGEPECPIRTEMKPSSMCASFRPRIGTRRSFVSSMHQRLGARSSTPQRSNTSGLADGARTGWYGFRLLDTGSDRIAAGTDHRVASRWFAEACGLWRDGCGLPYRGKGLVILRRTSPRDERRFNALLLRLGRRPETKERSEMNE